MVEPAGEVLLELGLELGVEVLVLEQLVGGGAGVSVDDQAPPQEVELDRLHALEQLGEADLLGVLRRGKGVCRGGNLEALEHGVELEGDALLLGQFLEGALPHEVVRGDGLQDELQRVQVAVAGKERHSVEDLCEDAAARPNVN